MDTRVARQRRPPTFPLMPKLSVILPVFNAQSFILDAVNSILVQTFRDFELILVDDASSDDTTLLLSSISDPRVRVIRHEVNRGLVNSLNDGLLVASGEYVARMDHDDFALPTRLKRQVDFLDHNPSIAVVGTGYRLIDSQGRIGLAYRPPISHAEIAWAMAFVCPIAHPTVMMRRSVIEAAGGYSEEASYAEDYDLWERLIHHQRFANIPDPLLLLRKHGGNMTTTWSGKHLSAATTTSARHIEYLLGEKADEAVVRCLRSQGCSDSHLASEASLLILRLLETAMANQAITTSLIRQDAAVRISLLGMRSGRVRLCLSCLMRAAKISPSFVLSLCSKLFVRLFWRGKATIG